MMRTRRPLQLILVENPNFEAELNASSTTVDSIEETIPKTNEGDRAAMQRDLNKDHDDLQS